MYILSYFKGVHGHHQTLFPTLPHQSVHAHGGHKQDSYQPSSHHTIHVGSNHGGHKQDSYQLTGHQTLNNIHVGAVHGGHQQLPYQVLPQHKAFDCEHPYEKSIKVPIAGLHATKHGFSKATTIQKTKFCAISFKAPKLNFDDAKKLCR